MIMARLSQDSWEPMEELISRYMHSPAVVAWWLHREVPFAKAFSEYVDSKIPAASQHELAPAFGSIWSGPAA